MELIFLALLVLTLIGALASGYPVAFALPGSAIITILTAAVAGYLFAGDTGAYFAQGNPVQWLNAAVTNFRGIYFEVERDTLIAIPLFVFMGIMLQRSKIAEDLLIAMAQLFGPVPGGLGISVVFVGALLAATTGIVGATVIAMGLISLPVMLRNKYDVPLTTGIIAASGTLGQIIPPSIVLIILADQLSSASDRAASIRKAEFRETTGSSNLPTDFDVTSTSAGEMFMGALLPGLVLVGLYMLYILIVAYLKKGSAPPVPYDGKFDAKFYRRTGLVLIPPLTLIMAVLGSIVLGIATVNQAGAIGAIGAMIMGGYRLMDGKKGAYYPALLCFISLAALAWLVGNFDINVKLIKDSKDAAVIAATTVAVFFFLASILWSGVRVYRIENTLSQVMVETAKTTSLVFIILLGAAMLTAAFRAFGGEDLVREFLSQLPGGFISKFVVVMAVIFILGFFLDFIEIAVVVVPIIAPILLADPSANITAVWLGVMIGVNIQTSFLTPPFGFALFYLRGVAPESVKTIQMYKGVVPFILLQLTGLAIVGFYPPLVNFLPNRINLTAETAPPPRNPRIQLCVERRLFADYDQHGNALRGHMAEARALDISSLPRRHRRTLNEALEAAGQTFEMVAKVRAADLALDTYIPGYRPLHRRVRDLQAKARRIGAKIEKLEQSRRRLSRSNENENGAAQAMVGEIEVLQMERQALLAQVPAEWNPARKTYLEFAKAARGARLRYRRTVDSAYEPIPELRKIIAAVDKLTPLEQRTRGLRAIIAGQPPEEAAQAIREVARAVGKVAAANPIRSRLSRARRALRGRNANPEKALQELGRALEAFTTEVTWRTRAKRELLAGLGTYDKAIRSTIGLRLQEKLPKDVAIDVAVCQSVHRDISLNF
ncbi:MAG: TRAP transporter large permease subunit [Rhodospirillales bacterium]